MVGTAALPESVGVRGDQPLGGGPGDRAGPEDGPQVSVGTRSGIPAAQVAERAVEGEGDRRVRAAGGLDAPGRNPDEGCGDPRAADRGVRVHRQLPEGQALRSGGPASHRRGTRHHADGTRWHAPPLRGHPRRPGPGRLGRRGQDPRPHGHPEGLLVPHDVVVLARPVLLLHHQPGPPDVLRLPPPRVRPLRWGADDDRLRPHEDRRPPPRRSG